MRELTDNECDAIIDDAMENSGSGFVRIAYAYVRAGYAAGYRAAQEEQSAATPSSAGSRADHHGAAQAVTDGPAADPDASVITYARIGLRYMHDPRVRATYSDLIDLAERMARERDDARAERDALRECVLAADQTARFDLAWLISAINVHRHLPRPVGPELPKWYAENDRWLREASEMLNKIYSAENTPGSAAQPAEPPARR